MKSPYPIFLIILSGLMAITTPTAFAQSTVPSFDFSYQQETAGTDVLTFNNQSDYPVMLMSNLAEEINSWRKMNPDKRLVSTAIIYTNDYRGNILIRGMLIHYERLPKQ